MLKNWCFWTVVLEKTLGSPLDCNEIKPVNPKGNQSWMVIGRTDWCWRWNSNSMATWCEKLTHWKRPWCWARLKSGEGDDIGWDGWMASRTRWTWVWVGSGSSWWTGKPGILSPMGSQRFGRDWATELKVAEMGGGDAGTQNWILWILVQCICVLTFSAFFYISDSFGEYAIVCEFWTCLNLGTNEFLLL